METSNDGWRPTEQGYYFHLAKAARDNGYASLIPITPGNKGCFLKGWPNYRFHPASDEEVRTWIKTTPRTGFGYAHNRRLVAFDIDCLDEAESRQRTDWLLTKVHPDAMMRIGKPPKVLVVFRASYAPNVLPPYGHTGSPEIYFDKGQTVFFGTHPDTQQPYRWQQGSPAVRALSDLPPVNGAQILSFVREFGGDSGAQYGDGSTSIKQFLKFASDNGIILMDMPLDLIKVIAIASVSKRHEIIKCAIAYARHFGHSVEKISKVLREPYLNLFKDEGIRTQRARVKDFDDLIAWARRKVS